MHNQGDAEVQPRYAGAELGATLTCHESTSLQRSSVRPKPCRRSVRCKGLGLGRVAYELKMTIGSTGAAFAMFGHAARVGARSHGVLVGPTVANPPAARRSSFAADQTRAGYRIEVDHRVAAFRMTRGEPGPFNGAGTSKAMTRKGIPPRRGIIAITRRPGPVQVGPTITTLPCCKGARKPTMTCGYSAFPQVAWVRCDCIRSGGEVAGAHTRPGETPAKILCNDLVTVRPILGFQLRTLSGVFERFRTSGPARHDGLLIVV